MASRNKKRDNYFKYSYKNICNYKKNDCKNEELRSQFYIAEKYGVTYHCVFRCWKRVFKGEHKLSNAGILRLAKLISKTMGDNIKVMSNGTYEFMDDYNIIIRENRALTIRYKDENLWKKEKEEMKGYKK